MTSIWIKTDCSNCIGSGTVEHTDWHGIVETTCTDCEGRGRLDEMLLCGGCDKPFDQHGFCDSCEHFASGYGDQRRAA